MKKLAKLSLGAFIIAVILTFIGGNMISGSGINYGDVYELLEENIPVAKSGVTFSKAPETDLSDCHDMQETDYAVYQLNEFNSLDVYADKCTLEFIPTTVDKLVVSLIVPDEAEDDVIIQTAIKDGTLYVKFRWRSEPTALLEDSVLTIGIPESYKGGFDINASGSSVSLCDIDSSMDIGFNLYNCNMTVESISAGEVTLESSGGAIEFGKITASGGFGATCVSSDLKVASLNAMYARVGANNSSLSLNDITGSISTDLYMTEAEFDFLSVTGNISASAKLSKVDIIIPSDSAVQLHHEERYSSFKNKLEQTLKNGESKNSYRTMDTNVELGIVSLTEKE